MVIGKKPLDIYARRNDDDPWAKVAEDVVRAAIEAVKDGELEAEYFFFSRYGENLILGLGADPEAIRMALQQEHNMSSMTLDHVVRELRRDALASLRTPVRVPLNGGLSLTMIYELTHWRLSMTRPKVEPSKAEIATCRKYFQIPDEVKAEKASQNKNGVDYFIVRFRWDSAVQLSFVEERDGVMVAYTGKKKESYYTTAA